MLSKYFQVFPCIFSCPEQLYKSSCWLVGRSVGWSVGRERFVKKLLLQEFHLIFYNNSSDSSDGSDTLSLRVVTVVTVVPVVTVVTVVAVVTVRMRRKQI